MEERTLEAGGFYRHFKNKLYQVKCIAYHSETKEKYVVYQALYGDFSVYVRPYDMFMSEVDHIKYPEVTQKYRFEQVKLTGDDTQKKSMSYSEDTDEVLNLAGDDTQKKSMSYSEDTDEVLNLAEADVQKSCIPYELEKFLDADSYEEKIKVLQEIRPALNDKLIDTMAVSLDIEVPQGDIDKRYDSLISCLRTHARYEGIRLR